MTYAGNRRIIDVDSHLFELDDFLRAVATDEEAAFIRPMEAQTDLPVSLEAIERGREHLDRRNADPELMAKFEAGMFDISRSPWSRLGAFDPAERSHALDVLGFERQIVLGTFSFHQIAHEDNAKALEIGARVHNRAMGRFCAHDDRLLAGGYVPLSLGPDVAGALLDEAFVDGCYTVMVDTNEADPEARSFTHPDFDPIWARFAEQDVPLLVHIAVNGHYDPVSPSFKNNGRVSTAVGGDAPDSNLGLVAMACGASRSSMGRRGCRAGSTSSTSWNGRPVVLLLGAAGLPTSHASASALRRSPASRSAGSLNSSVPTCSASLPTIPIPRARAIRSGSSRRPWTGSIRPRSRRSTPATWSASSVPHQPRSDRAGHPVAAALPWP